MKHDNQIQDAFEQAFDATKTATQADVDIACTAVHDKAAEQFGPQGIYVSGTLDADNQGVLFRFKRPGIGQRVTHFISCKVEKPKRKVEAQSEGDQHTQDDRTVLLVSLAENLGPDEFTKSGKPDVTAINAILPEDVKPFTAAERDNLWEA